MTTSFTERFSKAIAAMNLRHERAIPELLELYADDVTFRDPLQESHGKEAFERVNVSMFHKAKSLRFDIETMAREGDLVFTTWKLHFEPKIGPPLVIDGVSHLRLRDELVVLHRDYWDLLGSVMESIPFARSFYRAAVAKLG